MAKYEGLAVPEEFSLDKGIAQEALEVLTSKPYVYIGLGGAHAVWFYDDKAIKQPLHREPDALPRLINEVDIGRGLCEIGVNAPLMYGAHVPEEGFPFVVMSKLNIVKLRILTGDEFSDTLRKYDEQIAMAKRFGFNPIDTAADNFGLDRETGKVYLFDFEWWKRASKEASSESE